MPTEFVYIKGKLSWCRTHKLNPWGKYTVTIHPLPGEDLEKVRKLQEQGAKNLIKKDDDGYFVSYSRPSELTRKDGRKVGLTPVEVFDKEGNPVLQQVGNGSDGVVKLEVYSHKTPGGGTAKAARLMAVRVDEMVPYEPNRDMQKDEELAAQGLQFVVPKPNF